MKTQLGEIFNLFPKANWITQGGKAQEYEIKLHTSRPTIVNFNWLTHQFPKNEAWQCSFTDTNLKHAFTIEWGHRKTWRNKIVSRKEIMIEVF